MVEHTEVNVPFRFLEDKRSFLKNSISSKVIEMGKYEMIIQSQKSSSFQKSDLITRDTSVLVKQKMRKNEGNYNSLFPSL